MCAGAELTVHWNRNADLARVVEVIEAHGLRSESTREDGRTCYTDVLPENDCWCSPPSEAHRALQDTLSAVALLDGVELVDFLWDFPDDDPHTSFLTDGRQLPDVQAHGPTHFLHTDGTRTSAVNWYVGKFADEQEPSATLQALETNYLPALAHWIRGMRTEAKREAKALREDVERLEAELATAKSQQLLALPGLEVTDHER